MRAYIEQVKEGLSTIMSNLKLLHQPHHIPLQIVDILLDVDGNRKKIRTKACHIINLFP
jgi:hypothetical protein